MFVMESFGMNRPSVPESVAVTVKVYQCTNGDGPFDGLIRFGTHSVRQCKFDGDCDGDGDGDGMWS